MGSMQPNLKKLAEQLAVLPKELVESTLADLPLAAILGLSIAQPSISECTLRSAKWRDLHKSLCNPAKIASFETARANFRKLQNLFDFYLEVRAFSGGQQFSYTRPQGGQQELDVVLGAHHATISKFLRDSPILEYFRDQVDHYVATTAQYAINKLPPAFIRAVSESILVLRDPGSSTISSIRDAFHALRSLDHRVRAMKHGQLQQMTDLVEAHPLRLKGPLDPSQTPTTAKTAHLLAQFRNYTRNVPRGYSAKCFFHSWSLPVVPYDRCLRLFVAALEMEDLASTVSSTPKSDLYLESETRVSQKGGAMTEQGNWQNLDKELSKILSWDLNIAVAGLFELYDMGNELGSPRIWWDLHDEKGSSSFEKQPRVITDYYFEPYKDLRDRGPVYEQEIVWLKAFLRLVGFIEKRYPELTAQIYSDSLRFGVVSAQNVVPNRG